MWKRWSPQDLTPLLPEDWTARIVDGALLAIVPRTQRLGEMFLPLVYKRDGRAAGRLLLPVRVVAPFDQ